MQMVSCLDDTDVLIINSGSNNKAQYVKFEWIHSQHTRVSYLDFFYLIQWHKEQTQRTRNQLWRTYYRVYALTAD